MTTTRPTIGARTKAMFAAQHGTATARQLREIGVDRSAVARRVASGEWIAILPRVYVVGHVLESDHFAARCMAAVLGAGPHAALSHETAATIRGLWNRGGPTIDVTACRSNVHVPEWMHVRRSTTLLDVDIEEVDRIPTTSVTRTCMDLGATLTPHQLAAVLHEANFSQELDLAAIRARVDYAGGWHGGSVVRRAIALHMEGSAGTRSRSEDEYLRLVLAARFPEPLVNTRGSTNVRGIEVDFAWPSHRLAVEIDGAGHLQPGAAEHDRRRDEALHRAGWNVIRIPARRVWRAPSALIRRLGEALAL